MTDSDCASPEPVVSEPVVDDRGIPDASLRAALEFAVGIAAAGSKLRPPLTFPSGLRPYFKHSRLGGAALAGVRTCVVADPGYRERLASVATIELVDAVGVVWLQRPSDWVSTALALVREAAVHREESNVRAELVRAERRRAAAERHAATAQAELLMLRAELDRQRAWRDVAESQIVRQLNLTAKLEQQIRSMHGQLEEAVAQIEGVNTQARRSAEAAATALSYVAELTAMRDQLLAARANSVPAVAVLETATRTLKPKLSGRQPIAIPGGLLGNTTEATVHLVRTAGVEVVVDGYNLAKQAWPQFDLAHQRQCCIEALESLARRYGCSVHVIFDGADVVGTSGPRRLIRVSYSPAGTTADDVIRGVVSALTVQTKVVVATDDQEIVGSVRAMGANVVSCAQIVAAAGR